VDQHLSLLQYATQPLVAGDWIDEASGGGHDRVDSSISYSLAALPEVDDLVLTGSAALWPLWQEGSRKGARGGQLAGAWNCGVTCRGARAGRWHGQGWPRSFERWDKW